MKIARRILGIIALLLLAGLAGLILYIFLRFGVNDVRVPSEELAPELLGGISTLSAWEQERVRIYALFEKEVFGPVPKAEVAWDVEKTVLDESVFDGRASYELWTLTSPSDGFVFHIVALLPKTPAPTPLIVASNFCPNHLRFPEFSIPAPAAFPSMCGPDSTFAPFATFIFGSYIETFPFEEFASRGIAFASIYLAEGVPDDRTLAPGALERLASLTKTPTTNVLSAWAWEYREAIRIFEEDPRIDATRTAVYGHSRDGKAALLAAADDARIDLVLAHQSGKGGASPWRSATGESTEEITSEYPHWFAKSLASYAGNEEALPVDQHQLLALVAPRPLLISGARLDKWGDPAGSLQALRDASRAYALYGVPVAVDERLDTFTPKERAAFYMRSWFHGVQPSDWNAFLSFIETHFNLADS